MSVVLAEDVVVEFPIYGVNNRSLRNRVLHAATGGMLSKDADERVVVRALDSVNFEFNEGDRIGLVGHNGAGKTTLLRVIAGVYEPTSGFVSVQGRVTSMLSITMGMDFDATGIENIHIRGRLLGLTKKGIGLLVDDVMEFAELGDYLHLPLRTYSSGMTMRLAFAISTGMEADIILMDEWLSAGDADFAEKAKVRLDKMVGTARVLVLASHNMGLVQDRCNTVIRLEHGKIVANE